MLAVPADPTDPGSAGPERILVVGAGGRENSLGWALARCTGVHQVWVSPGNGGTGDLAGCAQLDTPQSDREGLAKACLEKGIDLVVIGPEAPLAAGLADDLRRAGLAVFGPGADGARLESSKRWAKQLMLDAGIPTASHATATGLEEALEQLQGFQEPPVVKADGLAAGKGVTVAESFAEARAAIEAIFAGRFGDAGGAVVLEERLQGPEVSVFALTDGSDLVILPPAQDHKRIGEGDAGPNTGGMGAYAPAPLLDAGGLETVRRTILVPTLEALARRGISYRGVIYGGLMLTATGPKVIEYNCRFGDPECQTLMPLLGPELARVLQACAEGRLAQAPTLSIDSACSACVVAAAEGYPENPRLGDPISGAITMADHLQLFHAGSRRSPDGGCLTSGGRVLAVVAQAPNFDDAFEQVYGALSQVDFEGISYRRDIGHQVRRSPVRVSKPHRRAAP